jgi:hypothetical protein
MREGRRGAGVAIALVAIVAVIAWLLRGGDDAGESRKAEPSVAPLAGPEALPDFGAKAEVAPSASQLANAETPETPAPAATTGRLVVLVTWASDETPAASVGVHVVSWAEPDALFHAGDGVTDAAGRWELAELRPGDVGVYLDRANGDNATIRAGETTELRLAIPPGVLVRGLVVDSDEQAVSQAEIRLSVGGGPEEGAIVAHSDAEGRFMLRDVGNRMGALVGATKAGHVPSPVAHIEDSGTHAQDVTLTLGPRGADVAGRVLDSQGAPIAGALVIVGPENGWQLEASHAQLAFRGQPPRRLVTDVQGGFAAQDLPPGKQTPIAARSRGHSPQRLPIELIVGQAVSIDITLPDGAVVSGTVTDQAGHPLAGASVSTGEYGGIEWVEAISAADGHYALADPALGAPKLSASLRRKGTDSTSIPITAGARLEWNPKLSVGLQILGRVVDAAGVPVAGHHVDAESDKPVPEGTRTQADTDEEGRFTLDNCANGEHELRVYSPDWTAVVASRKGVRPGPEEVVLRVLPEKQASAFVVGRVTDTQGLVPTDARVGASDPESGDGQGARLQPDGSFRIGPLEPRDWDLRVNVPGRPDWKVGRIALEPNKTRDMGLLVLPDTGSIVLHLTLPAGVEPSSVQCAAKLDSLGNEPLEAIESAPGSWGSGPLLPGDYTLDISNYGGKKSVWILPGQVAVTVKASSTSHADFAAEAGVSVFLRISTARHDPPPMKLTIKDSQGATALSQGLFWNDLGTKCLAIATLVGRPGSYALVISADGKPLVERAVNVPAGVTAGPDLEVEVP